MDLEYADKLWDRRRVEVLLFGRCVPDQDSEDGWVDVPGQSWYQLRCQARDNGDVGAMDDVIQFEWAVDLISDHKCRAAVRLAMMGEDFADIGAAIGGHRTGKQLVRDGVSELVLNERFRNELR